MGREGKDRGDVTIDAHRRWVLSLHDMGLKGHCCWIDQDIYGNRDRWMKDEGGFPDHTPRRPRLSHACVHRKAKPTHQFFQTRQMQCCECERVNLYPECSPSFSSSLPRPHPPYQTAHKVVVFSKTYCPFASRAKQTLQSEGAIFHVVELDQRNDGGEIQAALADMTGRRTVPNVFFDSKSIGGGDDTVALARSGRLREMLSALGALK